MVLLVVLDNAFAGQSVADGQLKEEISEKTRRGISECVFLVHIDSRQSHSLCTASLDTPMSVRKEVCHLW